MNKMAEVTGETSSPKGYALVKIDVKTVSANSASKETKKQECFVLAIYKTLDAALLALTTETAQFGDNYRVEVKNQSAYVYDISKVAGLVSYSRLNEHLHTYSVIKIGRHSD